MGPDLERRFQIWIALFRLAAGAYALYLLLPMAVHLGQSPVFVAILLLLYVAITDAVLFMRQKITIWVVVVLDSILCVWVVVSRDPLFLPLLLSPGLLTGLWHKHFRGYIIGIGMIAQVLVLAFYEQKLIMHMNPYLLHFLAEMILLDAISFLLAYLVFMALREGEQNKSLLDLIRIGQEMGASLDSAKVSALLMNVLTSMFDAHSYGFYVLEEKNNERMAVIRGIESAYAQVFLDFNAEAKDTLFSKVLHEKKIRVVNDLRAIQDRFLPSIRTFRGALLSPICFEEEALGLLFLISNTPGAYSTDQASLLELLSNQFAVTLKNILLYQQTATMAITDSLTGLYTHGFFQDQLVKQVTDHKYGKKPLSVIILDVDHFKVINDQHGHPQGDYILRQMAGLVRNTVRPKDCVCRYGGDEFVLITPGLDRISAAAYAERIRKAVEDYHFVAAGKIARITISAGVSSFPETAETPKELIDAADKALYEAKNRGRNRIVYL